MIEGSPKPLMFINSTKAAWETEWLFSWP
jgi:hypothetical protein